MTRALLSKMASSDDDTMIGSTFVQEKSKDALVLSHVGGKKAHLSEINQLLSWRQGP
jgi:hypothetical protein